MNCIRCRGTGKEPDWRGLGMKVRQMRVSKGMGLREMARHVRVSPAFISDLERGNRSWQGPKARAILDLLGMKGAA